MAELGAKLEQQVGGVSKDLVAARSGETTSRQDESLLAETNNNNLATNSELMNEKGKTNYGEKQDESNFRKDAEVDKSECFVENSEENGHTVVVVELIESNTSTNTNTTTNSTNNQIASPETTTSTFNNCQLSGTPQQVASKENIVCNKQQVNEEQAIKLNSQTLENNNKQFIGSTFNHLVNETTCEKLNNSQQQQQGTFCKQHRLNYIQQLILRKWPCFPIGICIMSSLLFGIILSALTVYLMHGMTDCSGYALAAISRSPLEPPHDTLRRPSDFDTPLELASVSSGAQLGETLSTSRYSSTSLSNSANLSEISGKTNGEQKSETTHRFRRLSSSLWPIHYDLFIQPYLAEPFNFNGKVSIRIKCTEATDNITLHSLDLKLDEQTLSLELADNASPGQLKRNQPPRVKGLSQDKELQHSIIELDGKLEPDSEYVLGIDFVGTLGDDLAGFYKIKYERQNSSELTWVAATQFQATDARRAFPCFDEPLYKATFSIKIKHWTNMTALSNMPIIDQQKSSDGLWITDTFGKSHRMSTYLVAFTVNNFESRSEGNISVWTRPGFAHTAEYALKIAGKILRHYEDFFGIEYPLPKMDMIALPDFNAGAMENWGLITYRETAMLYDETSSSVINKQRVAVVVAHELAHQWFGNLVTPKWWDDLWLNEGFASYVEYLGVDHVEPGWQMMEQFVVEEIQNVFKLDSLSSSHQISIPVNNPDEISEIFDHISYSKGSSIIRMMNHFLTEDVFKAGLRRYLQALKYSNAEQKDLWSHLTQAQRLKSNGSDDVIDVEKVMNSWTLQTGYPLVIVNRDYNKSKPFATLEQVRHQTRQQQQNLTNEKWEIPITFTSKSEQNWKPITKIWMHQNDSTKIEIPSSLLPKSNNDWILLNVNQVGYYRVNYDLRNWKLLIDQLNDDHKQISTINRAQILDDIFELAKSGLLDYKFVMEATKYIKKELDFLPFDSMFMSIAYIDDMLQRTPLYGDWRDYMAQLLKPFYNVYKDSRWTIQDTVSSKSLATTSSTNNSSAPIINVIANDVLAQFNQVNAIAWGCQVEEHCIQKAKSLFREWRHSGKNQINPALRYTVYCTSIENGSKDDWNFLWKAYTKEQNASERDRILRALACTKELWILSRYLEWTFDKTKPIRRQDGAYVFRMIAKNNYGRDIAFNFMRERWPTIREHYGKTSFSMGHLVRSVSNSMNTHIELSQLKSFYESVKVDVGTGKRAFQIAVEEVESNIAWRERNYKNLEDWLQNEVRTKVVSL